MVGLGWFYLNSKNVPYSSDLITFLNLPGFNFKLMRIDQKPGFVQDSKVCGCGWL